MKPSEKSRGRQDTIFTALTSLLQTSLQLTLALDEDEEHSVHNFLASLFYGSSRVT